MVAAVLGACGPEPSSPAAPARARGAQNLLLVTFDTTRADRLGCYGWTPAATPTIDRLAREGVRFETCIAVAPTTLPSHASILTGLLPFHHGARNNGTHFLPENVPTLAATLAEAEFDTGAVVSAFVLDSRFGLDRGFASYDDDLSGALRGASFGCSFPPPVRSPRICAGARFATRCSRRSTGCRCATRSRPTRSTTRRAAERAGPARRRRKLP